VLRSGVFLMANVQTIGWLAKKSGPRFVFGNDGTWSSNVEARAHLRRLRKVSPVAPAIPWGAQAGRTLRERGWLPMADFQPEIMDPILAGYQRVIDDPSLTRDMGARDRSAVRYVVDPVARNPGLRLLLDDRVREALTGYYGTHFRLLHVRMWRIASLPDDERLEYNYGNLWHTDGHRVTVMKLFVQISDGVSAENGALRLLDIPTTRLAMRGGYLARNKQVGLARRLVEDPSRTVFFDGASRSAILMNPNLCLHRAGVPQPGRTRGMVQLTFDVADQPPPGGDYFAELAPDINVIEGRPV